MHRSADSPCMSFSHVSGSVESPQINRCSPSSQTSPSFESGSPSSSASGTSSSSISSCLSSSTILLSSSSDHPMPSRESPSSRSSCITFSSFSSSHSAISPILLSARAKRRESAGSRSRQRTGTESSPSFFAASNLVCPAMMTLSSDLAIIGEANPNLRIDSAT